jgi:hypothetical protein
MSPNGIAVRHSAGGNFQIAKLRRQTMSGEVQFQRTYRPDWFPDE